MRTVLFLSLLFGSLTAWSFPTTSLQLRTQVLPTNFTAQYNFEGIVALSNCSGSLIQFENSRPQDPAYVLTNGHCLEFGFPKAGEVIYGRSSNRTFRLFNSSNRVVGQLNAVKISYAAMTKTDMALYQLKETYADIERLFQVKPLLLSPQHPVISDPIQVISGYWNRGYSCSIEAFIPQLKEDQWTMENSIRYSRPGCLVIGGTSGSPILHAQTRHVIGINNTGNESGRKCTMNNPCEIDENGNVTAVKGYSYGQQTYWVYSCLNASNEIDLSIPNCQLAKPSL